MELSEDPEAQSVLMYFRLTGHKRIEFAPRSDMELPGEWTGTESNNVLIWNAP